MWEEVDGHSKGDNRGKMGTTVTEQQQIFFKYLKTENKRKNHGL